MRSTQSNLQRPAMRRSMPTTSSCCNLFDPTYTISTAGKQAPPVAPHSPGYRFEHGRVINQRTDGRIQSIALTDIRAVANLGHASGYRRSDKLSALFRTAPQAV
jgi:hypothetical protein